MIACRNIGLFLFACVTTIAPASAADDFYQGKRITLVVGFNPGGGSTPPAA